MDFNFYDFVVNTATTPPQIEATTDTSTLVVRFPPQAIGEGVYPNPPAMGTLFCDPSPILSAVAGSSQLAFSFTSGQSIPLPTMTPADLLDWSQWTLSVPVVAQVIDYPINPSGGQTYPLPTAPGPLDTFIEFPFALYLAPTVYVSSATIFQEFSTTWTNRITPLQSGRVTDLSYTSLVRQDFLEHAGATVSPQLSAIWAADITNSNNLLGNLSNETPETFIYYGDIIT
jgi:hypothetical protein